ncbi:MAG: hypothetical protein M3454_11975 [Actinomycetota bacterium]|nr:hypothetical protein [Actinomycetota bacterium]
MRPKENRFIDAARLSITAGIVVALGGCAGPAPESSPVGPSGPPRVQAEVVARHAHQFNEDDPERRAGSQGEQIAAAYLVAHLQTAGYSTFLDAVPVSDLVRSTNVVTTPPSGRRPLVAVTVPYDTPAPSAAIPEAAEGEGAEELGLFLELARALALARPEHRVSFVALGAETAEVAGGRLGSRRLVIYQRERTLDPLMVVLEDIQVGAGPVRATGDEASQVEAGAAPGRAAGRVAEVFEAAGLEVMTVSGGAQEAGDALLEYLIARTR